MVILCVFLGFIRILPLFGAFFTSLTLKLLLASLLRLNHVIHLLMGFDSLHKKL